MTKSKLAKLSEAKMGTGGVESGRMKASMDLLKMGKRLPLPEAQRRLCFDP